MFVDGQIFSLQQQGGISRLYYEILRRMSPSEHCVLYRGFYQDVYDWSTLELTRNIGIFCSFDGRIIGRLIRMIDPLWLEMEWKKSTALGEELYVSTYYRLPRYRTGSRIIVGDYDCTHEHFPELFPNARKVMEMKRRAFSDSDLVLTISESSKRDVMRFYGVPDRKIEVFPLGVDTIFDMEGSPRSSKGCSKRKPYLLYVGSRAGYKNFSILQAAFEQGLGKDYDLVVVGGGMLSPAELEPFSGQVRWLYANDSRLRQLYQGAAAFVYPSRYEGFGLPPLEALACGCPVVVSDHPVAHEVLSDRVEYCLWNDTSGFIEAVGRAVAQDKQTRLRGHMHAREYSWEKAADSFISKVRQRLG